MTEPKINSLSAALVGSAALLLMICTLACGGRSLGAADPTGDGGPGPGPDAGWPNNFPDAAIVPDAATCEQSPLQGLWNGTFSGEVTSPVTGTLSVEGTVNLEIYCSDVLLVRGQMTGSEQSGASFETEVDGVYDSALGRVRATFDGWVETIPVTGSLEGVMWEGAVDHIDGTWAGEAPSVNGIGSGRWNVVQY